MPNSPAHAVEREVHHGRTPAAWFGSMFALVGFIAAAVGCVLGPNWLLIGIGAALIGIGIIGGAALTVAGLGQPPRP